MLTPIQKPSRQVLQEVTCGKYHPLSEGCIGWKCDACNSLSGDTVLSRYLKHTIYTYLNIFAYRTSERILYVYNSLSSPKHLSEDLQGVVSIHGNLILSKLLSLHLVKRCAGRGPQSVSHAGSRMTFQDCKQEPLCIVEALATTMINPYKTL